MQNEIRFASDLFSALVYGLASGIRIGTFGEHHDWTFGCAASRQALARLNSFAFFPILQFLGTLITVLGLATASPFCVRRRTFPRHRKSGKGKKKIAWMIRRRIPLSVFFCFTFLIARPTSQRTYPLFSYVVDHLITLFRFLSSTLLRAVCVVCCIESCAERGAHQRSGYHVKEELLLRRISTIDQASLLAG